MIEHLILQKLEEKIPNFDVLRADKRLYDAALNDFLNYYSVIWKLSRADVKIKAEEIAEDDEALKEFDAWVSLWYCAWKKRVKIVFKDETFNQRNDLVQKLIVRGNDLLGHQQLKVFKRAVIENLVKRGEICFTDVLADQLVKREIGRKGTIKAGAMLKTAQGKCDLLNTILNRVKDLCGTSGPLIFLKVDKKFWKRLYE